MKKHLNKLRGESELALGFGAGVPIGMGYLAVSFSLGIAAAGAGLDAVQSFVASALCMASAGEYAGFTIIAAGAGFMQMALMILIANARYLLMSFALSQKIRPEESHLNRLFMAFYLTDEIFAVEIARSNKVRKPIDVRFTAGAALAAAPCWALGTALGCVAGSVLPASMVSALSVTLFGMFLAVIIPPARSDRFLGMLICACFVLSSLFAYLPVFGSIDGGTKIILLTIIISAAAAVIKPVE